MTAHTEFLAGERPGDVAIFVADEHRRNAAALADHGERVEGGHVLVVAGERRRRVFPTIAGGRRWSSPRRRRSAKGRSTGA